MFDYYENEDPYVQFDFQILDGPVYDDWKIYKFIEDGTICNIQDWIENIFPNYKDYWEDWQMGGIYRYDVDLEEVKEFLKRFMNDDWKIEII